MSTDIFTPCGFTGAFDELAARLQANHNFQGKSWSREERRWSAERDMRREAVLDAWAAYYGGLVRTKRRHWQALFNKHAPHHYVDSLTPHSDHYSAWRYAGRNKPTEVVVSQPHCPRLEFSDWLPDFIAFANQHHLCFWISGRPAWYMPGRVCTSNGQDHIVSLHRGAIQRRLTSCIERSTVIIPNHQYRASPEGTHEDKTAISSPRSGTAR